MSGEVKTDNPRLKELLKSINATDSEIEKFESSRIEDVLLPFPVSGPNRGRGLPESFRHSDREALFLRRQTYVLSNASNLQKVFEEGSLEHRHLEKDAAEELFHRVTDKGELTSLVLPPRKDSEQRGGGGFSRVFVVRFKNDSDERLALKWFARPGTDGKTWKGLDRVGKNEDCRYPETQQRGFTKEQQILTFLSKNRSLQQRLEKIRAKHIIQLRASFTDPQAFCLILSPVGLCDLEELLQRFSSSRDSQWEQRGLTITREEIGRWLRQIFGCMAAGLLFLHRYNIRHKDIKPKNLLVINDGQNATDWKICLCDFGIAEWKDPDAEAEANETMAAPVHKHSTGNSCDNGSQGKIEIETPAYTTPERYSAKQRNFKDDMYLLGLVYLEIFTAIKGETKEGLEQYLKENNVSEFRYREHVPILRHVCTPGRLETWLERLGSDATDNEAIWIKGLLTPDPQDRLSSENLVKKIQHVHDKDEIFWGNCCGSFYNDLGNVVESALSEKNPEEKIVFRRSVSRWGRPGSPEIQEPSTIAVTDSRSLERRILIAKHDAWPFADNFEFDEWLPLTGIHIERQPCRRIVMKWSDFNNIISKTDNDYGNYRHRGFNRDGQNHELCVQFNSDKDAQVFIDLMHTFQPFPHGSKANVEEIPISDSQDIFLQTPIADAPNSIEPKVPVPYRAFFNVKKTIKDRSTIIVSTLYLLRDALPPLDMTLTVTAEEEYILELSGLDSIDYIGCEPTYGAIPTKASKVQKRNRVKHPLEFKLRPEIHARRGFCRFIEQLTNNAWGIRMLCLVPKVALPRHIGSNKFKDSLMILWQRCQTDETQLRVALKVKSKPGEWEWLVGELSCNVDSSKMKVAHQNKTCKFKLDRCHGKEKLELSAFTTPPPNSKSMTMEITFKFRDGKRPQPKPAVVQPWIVVNLYISELKSFEWASARIAADRHVNGTSASSSTQIESEGSGDIYE